MRSLGLNFMRLPVLSRGDTLSNSIAKACAKVVRSLNFKSFADLKAAFSDAYGQVIFSWYGISDFVKCYVLTFCTIAANFGNDTLLNVRFFNGESGRF